MKKYADYIFSSSAVFTGKTLWPMQGAVAVAGDRILDVGSLDSMMKYSDRRTKAVDCGDKLILPGFNDAHVHFMFGAVQEDDDFCLDLHDCVSEDACVDKVRAFAAAHPQNKWIYGRGWNENIWPDRKAPDRRKLDEYFPDRPVYLASWDIHSAWVNRKALEIVGFDRHTPSSKDGIIEHFPDGEPSGVLREPGVIEPFAKLALQTADLGGAVCKCLKKVAEYGITSLGNVYPCGGLPEKDVFEVFRSIEEAGLLTCRIHLFAELKKDLTDAGDYAVKYRSDRLRFAGLKMITDGVCESHTAYLLDPYADDPSTRGELLVEQEELKELVIHADGEGYGVRLHCIGNGAVRNALDCFEVAQKLNRRRGLRHAIEHIETCHPADMKRFAELGVVASMQPVHAIMNIDGYPSLVGEKWIDAAWPMRSLIDAGASMAYGTDFPVTGLNTMEGIYAAITRQTFEGYPENGFVPGQRITLGEVLQGYTNGSARMENFDNEIGTLSTGKLADLVILDRNLFDIPPKEILETKVLVTMLGGQVVYRDPAYQLV